jgi:uncharacterized protein YfaS (alpha-2-macroglobulin family)
VRLSAKDGGVYRLLASVADAQGRENETELRVWVAGAPAPPRRALEQEEVTLVPDRREYQPGDVAKLLVMAPFAPAEGVLTLRRGGLLREERFTIAAASTTLAIPIEDGFTPNCTSKVDLVGAAARDAIDAGGARPITQRPAFATGRLELPVPPRTRTLALAVAPREPALEPGGATVLELSLRDASGAPAANAEAAVVVVDEAVLALSGYRLPGPARRVLLAAQPRRHRPPPALARAAHASRQPRRGRGGAGGARRRPGQVRSAGAGRRRRRCGGWPQRRWPTRRRRRSAPARTSRHSRSSRRACASTRTAAPACR